VLGKLKSKGSADRQLGNRRHYIMVVLTRASGVSPGSQMYMSLGAGYIPGKLIGLWSNRDTSQDLVDC
jgi:hypothetical protein